MHPQLLSQPRKNRLFAIFFWLFNLSLLLVVYVGFLPFLGVDIFRDLLQGEVPLSILLPVLGLVGVPTTSAILGLRENQTSHRPSLDPSSESPETPQRQPITLFQIFFGLEAPLLMACTIRLFFLRDLTPASAFIFISLTLGTIAIGHWLLHRHHPDPSPASWAQLTGLTLILALSIYLAAIALFYVLPTLVAIGWAFYASLFIFFLLPILFPFIMLFAGLVSMPWGMVGLFSQAWWQLLRQLSSRYGRWPRVWVGSVLALWLIVLLLLQQQPQTRAFDLLAQPPQSDSDRQALLQQSTTIRKGLLNAYLGSYRYPLVEDSSISDLYQGLLWFPAASANAVQAVYNALLTPFAFKGTKADQAKAEKHYAEFFDTPILRGEHNAIQTAVLSNFNRTEAKAGLLDINAERVQLQQQEVTVTPQGDWAEVELHEVYANTTFETTEILYYFSLPESATITGLWLGETNERAYAYTVSPRGAAQQVYNDQVQRSVDPALLEQVGPRNYRLRAFPIPPKGQDSLPQDGQPDRMHLWLTYKVMKQDGQWKLPVLSERRNLFWTPETQRFINGQPQKSIDKWLPTALPADSGPAQTAQAKLSNGYVVVQPLSEQAYQLPQNQRFAILLDRSYSMKAHRKELSENLQWLTENVLPTNRADLFLTSAGATKAEKVEEVATFEPEKTVFYGTLQTRQMLEQYQRAVAAEPQPYDAVLLITDAGSYELTQDGHSLALKSPLWLVHLGGLPAAYDDATLETIQRTGGSTVTHVQTALTRQATQPNLSQAATLLDVVDGYAWFLNPAPEETVPMTETLAPMAARRWVAQMSQTLQPNQLQQLDAIHQVAKENSIVTPYSSMLVLVNEQQKQQLKAAEEQSDRFQREIEDQQLPAPQNAVGPVSAVPEPSAGLLLLAGGAVLYALKGKN